MHASPTACKYKQCATGLHCNGLLQNAGSAAITELRRIVEQETAELSRSKYAIAELVSHQVSSACMAIHAKVPCVTEHLQLLNALHSAHVFRPSQSVLATLHW